MTQPKKHKWMAGWVSQDLQGAECLVCGKQVYDEYDVDDCELGKFGIVLTEEELQESVEVIEEWTNLVLTPRQLSEVLMMNEDMKKSIRKFGIRDTVEIETIADRIVYHIGFHHWPCNFEMGTEYSMHFWSTIWDKAIEYGYGVGVLKLDPDSF